MTAELAEARRTRVPGQQFVIVRMGCRPRPDAAAAPLRSAGERIRALPHLVNDLR
jgi:hypothetical protein